MRLKSTLYSFLLCILLLTVLFAWYTKPAAAATRIVPDDYDSIQAAINAANNGDIIEVRNGTYLEEVVVNKSVTLRGDYRNVEHPRNPLITIVDALSGGTVFQLNASNVHLSYFTIRNSGSGACGLLSDAEGIGGHTIENNIITLNDYGIYLAKTSNNKVSNNKIINNIGWGISLVDSSNNKILNNRIDNNTGYGIQMTYEVNDNVSNNIISESAHGAKLLGSTDNYLINNTVSLTSYGIYISDTSPRNTVKYNNVKAETAAIYVGSSSYTVVDHNIVTAPGSTGIYLYNSDRCNVTYNTVSGNLTFGIRLYYSCDYNYFYSNKIEGTRWAIHMEYSSNHDDFVGNWLQENKYGVQMSSCDYETYYYNNFINNTVDIFAEGTHNTFNDSARDLCPKCGQPQPKGNHWDKYPGVDDGTQSTGVHNCAGDGVGDTEVPYLNLDWYPLMEPWSEYDVGVVSVTLSNTSVYVGDTLNITVVVENEGKGGQSATFNVTVRDGIEIIETQTVTNLASGANTTLFFYWDTTYVAAPFNHTISTEAVAVTDELDTTDNLVFNWTYVSRRPGPWWYIPGNYMIHVQPGSSRTITIAIGWHNETVGGKNMTIAYPEASIVLPLWDRYNISFASPVNGKVELFMPQDSFSSRPFYLRNVTLPGTPFSFYTWGKLELVANGNGTMAIEDDVLDVDMTVTVTGYGNGTYSQINRTVGDGTPDPAGSLMIDMPLNLTVYVGTSPTDPTWQADLVTIPFPVWLTTGKANVTIIDSAPFPTGTANITGYTDSAEGSLLDPLNASITVVACGGGLDLYFELLGAKLYNDFMFKEVEVIATTVMTDATVSSNEIFEFEEVDISTIGINQLYYPMNITVTVKAEGTQEITINVTTIENVAPRTPITFTANWSNIPAGIYTIKVVSRGQIKIDGTIVNVTDIWVAGTLKVRIPGDIDFDWDVDSIDFNLFSGAYGTTCGHPKYNPECDFDRDCDVDSIDFNFFSGNYGRIVPV